MGNIHVQAEEKHTTSDPGNLPALLLTEWCSLNISGEIVADDRSQRREENDLYSKAGESCPCTRSHNNPFIWNEDLEKRGIAVVTVVWADPGISIRSLSKLLWNVSEGLCSQDVYSLASHKSTFTGMPMEMLVVELSVNCLPVPSGYMLWPFPESQMSVLAIKVV